MDVKDKYQCPGCGEFVNPRKVANEDLHKCTECGTEANSTNFRPGELCMTKDDALQLLLVYKGELLTPDSTAMKLTIKAMTILDSLHVHGYDKVVAPDAQEEVKAPSAPEPPIPYNHSGCTACGEPAVKNLCVDHDFDPSYVCACRPVIYVCEEHSICTYCGELSEKCKGSR